MFDYPAASSGCSVTKWHGNPQQIVALYCVLLLSAFTGTFSALANDELWVGFAVGIEGRGPHWDIGRAIAVDNMGNVYVVGSFSNSPMDFDPGPGTAELDAVGDSDIFVLKLDAGGHYVWAKALGGTLVDAAQNIAVDGSGNVLVAGRFKDTVDFDPGPGTVNLTAAGNGAFVLKLDPDGNYLWAVSVDGVSQFVDIDIAVDSLGNVHVTGGYAGTVDFDPDVGTVNVTSQGYDDIFVLKLDASGSFVWVRAMGGSGKDEGLGISVDSSGNVLTTGFFADTVDFDPGLGVFELVSESPIVPMLSTDVFVHKMNAAGQFLWAVDMGSGSFDGGIDIAVDSSGNVCTTGHFRGFAVDFDPGPGTANLNSGSVMGVLQTSIFIQKLAPDSSFIWVAKTGDHAASQACNGIAVDDLGNVYTTGQFAGTLDFDPGPGEVEYFSSVDDAFVQKHDAAGNFEWAYAFGRQVGIANDFGSDVAVDAFGSVHLTGGFQGNADFDPGPGTYILSGGDFFVLKLIEPFAVLPTSSSLGRTVLVLLLVVGFVAVILGWRRRPYRPSN